MKDGFSNGVGDDSGDEGVGDASCPFGLPTSKDPYDVVEKVGSVIVKEYGQVVSGGISLG